MNLRTTARRGPSSATCRFTPYETIPSCWIAIWQAFMRLRRVFSIRLSGGILKRFPEDFAFQLTKEEWEALRSQFVTLKAGGRGRHRKYRPWAFTEHGALMAAAILNSAQAVAMSVYVVRAFVKMREELTANAAILQRLAEIEKTLLTHDSALGDLYQKLLPLLQPAPEEPKPRIGFHAN